MDSDNVRRVARIYARSRELTLSTIGTYAAGDGKFFARLKAGKTCTVRTYNRVLQWFSDHWPEDAEWPADIPRPPVTPPEPEEVAPAGDEAAPAGADGQVEEPVA